MTPHEPTRIARAQRSVRFEYWFCLVASIGYGTLFGMEAGAPFIAASLVIAALEKRT